LNLLLKLLALISIYYIIDTSSESYWFFILIGGANMLTGIYSIYILQTKYNISFVVPKAREVKEILINDFPLLLSNILSIMLLSTNVTILKFTISEQELGLYSLSERILYALWQILSVFAVSIYPYICNFNKDTLIKLRKFLANIFFPFFGIVLIISLIVAFFSDKIVQFLFINSIAPDSLQISGQLLKFMMLTFILACTNIPAHQTLLAYGYKNICTKIFTIAVILNIFLGLIGSHLYGIIGITISFTIVILFLSIALNLTAFKKLNA
jgi:PST family polysaccharide transporter